MTTSDFQDTFLTCLDARWPGVKSWLVARPETTNVWIDTLTPFPLESILKAVDAVFEGDLDPSYTQLVRLIRRHADANRPSDTTSKLVDWKAPRFKCRRCEDSGYLMVWAQPAYDEVKETGTLENRYKRELTIGVGCACGQCYLAIPHLMANHDVIVANVSNINPLIDAVNEGKRIWFKPKRYFSEFSAWEQ